MGSTLFHYPIYLEVILMRKAKYALITKSDRMIEASTIDGLTFEAKYPDISDILSKYPHDSEGWFFNSTKDRYIAESFIDCVVCNPQLFWQNGFEITT
jgi:hypothetical protein